MKIVSKALRMARVKGSHSFICHPHVIHKWNEPSCLYPQPQSSSARITGDRGDFPHCGCGPHVIHGVEVSALSAPRCRLPITFS